MTYYFIDDFNDICRQKDGVDKDFAEVIDLFDLIEDINKFVEEIEELKAQYNLLREQRNEFHHGARENANRVGKLKKENKELKRAYNVCKFRRMNDANVIYCLEKENEEFKKRIQELSDYIKELGG